MEEEIKKAVKFLEEGKVILYPTDTIWGIGCDATKADSVEKVYNIKERNEKKNLIVLLDSYDKLKQYVGKVPEVALDLINSITTPLTIIYPGARNLAANVIADDGTIAIRIARDSFCIKMIAAFGKPIVSTSANVSGEAAPVGFSKISEKILNKVDHIVNLNRGIVTQTKPSTIIRLQEDGSFDILRK